MGSWIDMTRDNVKTNLVHNNGASLDTYPYNVAPYYESFSPETMFALEIVGLDRPGLLSMITQEIYRLGGNLSFLVTSQVVGGRIVFFLIIRVESKDSLLKEKLVSRLRELDGIIDVREVSPLKKIVYSRSLFPPTISGYPTINLTLNNLIEIHKDLVKTYGVLNTEIILNGIARVVGRALGKIAREQELTTIKELIEYLRALYLVSGRGYVSSYLVTENMIRIDFQYLAEKNIVDELNKTVKQKTKLIFEPVFIKHFIETASNMEVVSVDMRPKQKTVTTIIKIKR